jgi:hypothetical protein
MNPLMPPANLPRFVEIQEPQPPSFGVRCDPKPKESPREVSPPFPTQPEVLPYTRSTRGR